MSTKRIVTTLAAALLLTGVCLSAAPAERPGDPKTSKTPTLHDVMDTMDTAYRKLSRQIKDPAKNASSLAYVRTMQKSAIAAMAMEPGMAGKLPEAERPRFLIAYKRQIVKLVVGLLDLEAAILDGDSARAQSFHKRLRAIKRTGHKNFQDEEEDG